MLLCDHTEKPQVIPYTTLRIIFMPHMQLNVS
uniref:Uncharacterized protein n=1 Tax=Arundo donax TaxID=35708 RepID=A0A0A9AZ38_ARUDO